MSRQDVLSQMVPRAHPEHGELVDLCGSIVLVANWCQAREEFFRVKKVVEKKKQKLARRPQGHCTIDWNTAGLLAGAKAKEKELAEKNQAAGCHDLARWYVMYVSKLSKPMESQNAW